MRTQACRLGLAALTASTALGGCVAASALDATGTVLATGVKVGAKTVGAAVGVAADGAGALARTVTGGPPKSP